MGDALGLVTQCLLTEHLQNSPSCCCCCCCCCCRKQNFRDALGLATQCRHIEPLQSLPSPPLDTPATGTMESKFEQNQQSRQIEKQTNRQKDRKTKGHPLYH